MKSAISITSTPSVLNQAGQNVCLILAFYKHILQYLHTEMDGMKIRTQIKNKHLTQTISTRTHTLC